MINTFKKSTGCLFVMTLLLPGSGCNNPDSKAANQKMVKDYYNIFAAVIFVLVQRHT